MTGVMELTALQVSTLTELRTGPKPIARFATSGKEGRTVNALCVAALVRRGLASTMLTFNGTSVAYITAKGRTELTLHEAQVFT